MKYTKLSEINFSDLKENIEYGHVIVASPYCRVDYDDVYAIELRIVPTYLHPCKASYEVIFNNQQPIDSIFDDAEDFCVINEDVDVTVFDTMEDLYKDMIKHLEKYIEEN